jgi:sensor histidine kinase regulating citrate/malate metabolism
MYMKWWSKINFGLKSRMILVICSLVIGMLLCIGILANHFISETLEDQIGKRALGVARTVALIPELREAFKTEDPASIIQPIVEPIREATGAEFIVVGNIESVRYSHPLPDRLGKRMVGDDNERALLHAESYVSKATGSLGPSLRGKVPILDEGGKVIGLVSVGFLIDHIETIIGKYENEIWVIVTIFMSLGIIGAILIASYYKQAILGLEPAEITHMFLQKEAILQSIHEGIISIDRAGRITMLNHAALKLLSSDKSVQEVIGQPITSVLPNTRMLEVLESRQSQYDQEMIVGVSVVIANRVPVIHENNVVGVVSTFRNKTEIDRLTHELSKIRQYADALRAQTHEFSNKLYTLSGLMQLNKVSEAIELIHNETKIRQDWIDFLNRAIPDPIIGGILLGKLSRASEIGVNMIIDEESSMAEEITDVQDEVLTILGNVLENAFEAAKSNRSRKPMVKVFLTDIGNDFVFEIEDSGNGIEENLLQSIYKEGFSTKEGSHRGFGLALVQHALNEVGGYIFHEQAELGGSCFTIVIPKGRRGENVG